MPHHPTNPDPELDDFDAIPTVVDDPNRDPSDEGGYVLVNPTLAGARPRRRPREARVGWWIVAVIMAVAWGVTVAGFGVIAVVVLLT